MKNCLAGFAVEVLRQKDCRDVWTRVGVFPSLAEALSRTQQLVNNDNAEIACIRVDPYLVERLTNRSVS